MLIDQPWGISASGQGTASVEPDHAVVTFAINRLTDQTGTSLAEAKAAATEARASLRANGVADDAITSSRTNIHSIWDGHGASRRLVGHQCRIELAARLTPLDIVEACLIDLVDAGADEILSVTYDTTREPELWADARRQAIESARSKAAAYADACEVELGPVVHVEDLDAANVGMGPTRLAAMAPGGGPGDPLQPGAVVVNAAVVVGFSIAG